MQERHHRPSAANRSKTHTGVSVKRVLKLFLLYLAMALALAGWIDYSSYDVLNPLWMALFSVVAAALVTAAHVYHGKGKPDENI